MGIGEKKSGVAIGGAEGTRHGRTEMSRHVSKP